MNSKEIKEALEIIKKPITVNCIEYKYFDDENYNKLLEVYENCLWFANNFEQINLTVENLQKENKQLKENNLAMQEEMARTWAKLQQKEDVIKQLLTYLDKNKLTLNNPNILDFYINVKKILNIEKSDK